METDADRFRALFEEHHAALLAYALRRVVDAADAADVVSETFLVAWRRLDEVPDEPRPWLFGVARRVLANHHRGERRRLALADRLREAVVEVVPPLDADVGDVAAALARITEPDREILRLHAWEQLAHDEIAVVMGLSRGAVRVRLHRARRRLQAQMDALAAADAGVDGKRIPLAGHVSSGWAPAHPDLGEA